MTTLYLNFCVHGRNPLVTGVASTIPEVATVARVATEVEVARVATVAIGLGSLATTGHLAKAGGHSKTQQNSGSGHSGHRGHLLGRVLGREIFLRGRRGVSKYYILKVARVARVATGLIFQWLSSGHLVAQGGQWWPVASERLPKAPRPPPKAVPGGLPPAPLPKHPNPNHRRSP